MEPLTPYGHLRGFNYTPSTAYNDIMFWRDYDEVLVERELTYAQRLGLNSARVFLHYVVYERERVPFLRHLTHFVRTAHERGISTMPVVWDSCFSEVVPAYDTSLNDWIPNPGVQRLGPAFWPAGERYCRDLVQTLGGEPGLLLWDMMNEPLVTSYIRCEEPERSRRIEIIWTFARHFCEVMHQLDPRHPLTVGVEGVDSLATIAPDVDVLSFHDYHSTRAAIRAHLHQALRLACNLQKPLLVSEIGCLARTNPYDVTLEICYGLGLGWYVWELMIGHSRWNDIHGIVYPDGTVRDPSIVAAVQGFFRKRTGEIIPPNLNKEGAVTHVLANSREWLSAPQAPYAAGLLHLEEMANLLEAGELVPMCRPPSVLVLALAEETADNRQQVRRLLEEWGQILADAMTP